MSSCLVWGNNTVSHFRQWAEKGPCYCEKRHKKSRTAYFYLVLKFWFYKALCGLVHPLVLLQSGSYLALQIKAFVLLWWSVVCPRGQVWDQFWFLCTCFRWGTEYSDTVLCCISMLTTHSCTCPWEADCFTWLYSWISKNWTSKIFL